MGANSLESLVDLVRQLRAPDGCPWDREQTHESITGFLIEEAYEVVHAIREHDSQALRDELGDLLLHVAFHAQIADEERNFNLQDVIDGIHEKVIRRHPHVFGDSGSKEIGQIKQTWEELKAQEPKKQRNTANSFPALVEARKLIEKSSNLDIEIDANKEDLSTELKEALDKHLDGGERATASLLFFIVERARVRGQEAEILLKEHNRRVRDSIDTLSSKQSQSTQDR